MSAETRGRVQRWLPWLVVCGLILYVVSPSPTQPRPRRTGSAWVYWD